jgi:hypothetical protein
LVLVAMGCERDNASHCANRAGAATCEARGDALRYCSACEAEHDGCVASPPATPECATDGPATDPGAPATGTATDAADDDDGATADGPGMTGPLPGDGSGSSGGDDGGDSSSGEPPLPVCGDGIAEGNELCDGPDLGAHSCASVGGRGGTLACSDDCTLDPSDCDGFQMCGDGVIESPEVCDGLDLGGADCSWFPPFTDGELSCAGCLFNTTGCCKGATAACSTHAECCSGSCTGVLDLLLKQCQ